MSSSKTFQQSADTERPSRGWSITEAWIKLMSRSQTLQYIDPLSGKGKLEEATHRYALIVVDLINDAAPKELLLCHTPEELSTWIRRDALAWQAKLSDRHSQSNLRFGMAMPMDASNRC